MRLRSLSDLRILKDTPATNPNPVVKPSPILAVMIKGDRSVVFFKNRTVSINGKIMSIGDLDVDQLVTELRAEGYTKMEAR